MSVTLFNHLKQPIHQQRTHLHIPRCYLQLGITVMMNGAALRPTTDYTSSAGYLTIISAQSEYDKFVVSYTYTDN